MQQAASIVRGAPGSAAMGLVLRVGATRLGGTASIHEGVLAPDELVPPHTHSREDQCLYVVSGRVVLEVGDDVIDAPAGSFVVKPKGVSHAFWNPEPTLTHVLEISCPGGFESFHDEMAATTGPDEAAAVAARYGMTFHHDRIDEVRRRLRSPSHPSSIASAPTPRHPGRR